MKLEELFALVLDVQAGEFDDAASPETVMSWDSMAALRLVSAMEDAYGVAFSAGEIRSMRTLGEARRPLRQKGAPV
jgi:acyl carrier protein